MIAIGEASRLSGIGIETIRYYEREGIMPRPGRAANNRRLYSKNDVGRLRFLKRCRDLGFTLADTKTLIDLSQQKQVDCQSVKNIADVHKDSIKAKISALRRLEAALNELTANCSSGSVKCPLLGQLCDI